jgi:hypothetical protein
MSHEVLGVSIWRLLWQLLWFHTLLVGGLVGIALATTAARQAIEPWLPLEAFMVLWLPSLISGALFTWFDHRWWQQHEPIFQEAANRLHLHYHPIKGLFSQAKIFGIAGGRSFEVRFGKASKGHNARITLILEPGTRRQVTRKLDSFLAPDSERLAESLRAALERASS